MQKYPNSGRLNYAKNKVNPNSADLWGDITIERALLKQLLEESDADDIVIKLSGWQKDGNYGPWFSIKINTWKPEQQQVPPKPEPPADDDIPFN